MLLQLQDLSNCPLEKTNSKTALKMCKGHYWWTFKVKAVWLLVTWEWAFFCEVQNQKRTHWLYCSIFQNCCCVCWFLAGTYSLGLLDALCIMQHFCMNAYLLSVFRQRMSWKLFIFCLKNMTTHWYLLFIVPFFCILINVSVHIQPTICKTYILYRGREETGLSELFYQNYVLHKSSSQVLSSPVW